MKNEKVVVCDWGGVVESYCDVYFVFQSSIHLIKLYTNEYSDDEKMYKEYKPSEFLVSEKELILKEEIESIKRMVPPNKRYKYYR